MISQVRYFRCPIADVDDKKKWFFIWPHLSWFRNAKVIATTGDTAILNFLIGPETANYVFETLGITDIFNPESITILGLEDYYIGDSIDDIIAMYPELEGQYQSGINEDGTPVMRDKIDPGGWAGIL